MGKSFKFHLCPAIWQLKGFFGHPEEKFYLNNNNILRTAAYKALILEGRTDYLLA